MDSGELRDSNNLSKKRKIEDPRSETEPPVKRRKLEDLPPSKTFSTSNLENNQPPRTSNISITLPRKINPSEPSKKVVTPSTPRETVPVFQGLRIPKKKITDVQHKYPTRRRKRKRRIVKKPPSNDLKSSNTPLPMEDPISKSTQERSRHLNVKLFYSWVSSTLIHLYCKKGMDILSFHCGTGLNLQKFQKVGVRSWTGVSSSYNDLVEVSVKYNKRLEWNFEPCLICFDFSRGESLLKLGLETKIRQKYDIICSLNLSSCLEKYFTDYPTLSNFFENISNPLKPGGCFITIVKDGYVLKRKLEESESRKFGNSLYSVDFEEKNFFLQSSLSSSSDQVPSENAYSSSSEEDKSFLGLKYKFSFFGENEKQEYLVHPAFLKKMGRRFGLRIDLEMNFHEFIMKYQEEYNFLFSKFLKNGDVTKEDWSALYLYRVFVFRKIDGDVKSRKKLGNMEAVKSAYKYSTHHHFIKTNEIVDLRPK